ncbi:MAG: response regulator [Deltaproteobacteria bacterium]|nr:response regulator [Deltaproteobacteria bacterium]
MIKTILVVESDSTVRSLVRYSLAYLNYEIMDAGSREDAFEKLNNEKKPDLIITGSLTSLSNPVELVREIRNLPGLRFVPILMMAAVDTLGAQMEWKEAGATCWITRPFRQEELVEMVELLFF